MKKSRIWAGMLALLLMLTGCGTEEGKYDVFREAVAQTPECELPKSTIMQSAPPPEYVITDAVEQYEKEEHFPISATNESAQGRPAEIDTLTWGGLGVRPLSFLCAAGCVEFFKYFFLWVH